MSDNLPKDYVYSVLPETEAVRDRISRAIVTRMAEPILNTGGDYAPPVPTNYREQLDYLKYEAHQYRAELLGRGSEPVLKTVVPGKKQRGEAHIRQRGVSNRAARRMMQSTLRKAQRQT
jgi:hypothetical protein